MFQIDRTRTLTTDAWTSSTMAILLSKTPIKGQVVKTEQPSPAPRISTLCLWTALRDPGL